MEIHNFDIFTAPRVFAQNPVLCVTTNGVVLNEKLVMGKGVALVAKQIYPELPALFGKMTMRHGLRVFCVANSRVSRDRFQFSHIVAFPTKEHFSQGSDIDLIRKSAMQLDELIKTMDFSCVCLPAPGCKNGGLTWDYVHPVLNSVFSSTDALHIFMEKPNG